MVSGTAKQRPILSEAISGNQDLKGLPSRLQSRAGPGGGPSLELLDHRSQFGWLFDDDLLSGLDRLSVTRMPSLGLADCERDAFLAELRAS